MEENKMYINIVDGDIYNFTYKVKEYEIVEKHYTPTISNKSINVTIECCFEEDKPLIEWVRQYAEGYTGRSRLVYATGHQHIVVRSDIDVLCDFDNCKFKYIDVKEDNEAILTFSISHNQLKLDDLCGNLDCELSKLKELPFKIGDEVMVDYTDIETGELKSIESKIQDICRVYDTFTFEPKIIVTVTNDLWRNGRMVGDWRKDIKVK